MRAKDFLFLSQEKIKHTGHVILHFLLRCQQCWYRWTCQKMPPVQAPLVQREAAQRGRFTSMVLLIFFVCGLIIAPLAFLSTSHNLAGVYEGYLGAQAFVIVAAFCNRRGHNSLAGCILILGVEITFIIVVVTAPSGLDIGTLPMLDLFVLPTLLAVSMLAPWSVFPVALGNISIICLLILFTPKAASVQALLMTLPSAVYAIPLVLQIVIAGVSFLWVRGALQTVREADRANELDRLYQEQSQFAETDTITNLPNHRAIMRYLLAEVVQCEQALQTCTVMFVDLDHFKRINDTWGHLAGDAVLREVGRRLALVAALYGMVGRYGGEEFAVVLKGINLSQACQIAEQARMAIAATVCTWLVEEKDVALVVSASIGVATYGLHGTTAIDLLDHADRAMYRAKQQGRNRVCVADVASADAESEGMVHPMMLEGSAAETAAIQALTAAAMAHDEATGLHASRMVALADITARRLECSEEERHCIRLAAILHDVGKIGIPEAILHKPGALTAEEWVTMRTHPAIGSDILTQVEGVLDQLAYIVRAHHERWDGQGYPAGLVHDAIPLGARILSVVDSYDAMTSTRPYRQALPHSHARVELLRCAGTQYDPHVVEAFLEALELQEPSLVQSIESARL